MWIPRDARRKSLADDGLLKRLEFSPVKKEISTLFSKPFNLEEHKIENGERIEFDYLRSTAPGSRTLCIPPTECN